MIRLEGWMKVQELRQQGMSISEISRTLHLDRKTAHGPDTRMGSLGPSYNVGNLCVTCYLLLSEVIDSIAQLGFPRWTVCEDRPCSHSSIR